MKRNFSHITPRYIKDRLLVILDERKNPKNPWITAHATRLLQGLLKPTDIGVEFGSGRSTAWFANRLQQLTSVESNPEWYAIVKQQLAETGLNAKVDYRLCTDDGDYARQALTFTDASIHFCLVDGVARDHCALNMVPKMKTGGLLVLDNANLYLPNDETHSPNSRRMRNGAASEIWAEFEKSVSGWRRIWTTNGVSDTTIWIKP